jgi:hypothetical protein
MWSDLLLFLLLVGIAALVFGQLDCRRWNGMLRRTYGSVGSLLLFVTLLVGSSLGLEGSLLLLVEGLPLLTEDLANITC